jgi:hypothetical protein
MTMTFGEWRRANSGTRADYENYVTETAAQAGQGTVTCETIQSDAEDERLRLENQELREHAANLQAEVSRHERATRHIADTYRLRLTAVPEPVPASPFRRVILAALLETSAPDGLLLSDLALRVNRADGLQGTSRARVSRELEALRIDGYVRDTAEPPDPVRWTLTTAARSLATKRAL